MVGREEEITEAQLPQEGDMVKVHQKGSSYLPGVQIDLENAKCHTKIFKEAPKSEPFIITRARALVVVLDNMPLFITDHSRIQGYPGSAPHLIKWIPTASFMINEDLINDRTGVIYEK
ncbi:MAG: hypothetical protein SWO11_03285 [Thermodesulfobacteriota bacterium]|nr:hypothetical protein [Thermodesulfobacteriota bacterium]